MRFGGRFARRVLDMGWVERGVMLEAVSTLAAVRIAMPLLPRRAVGTAIRTICNEPGRAGREGASPCVPEVVGAIELVRDHVPRTTCLSAAVAGWLMLRRRRVHSVVRIGARRRASGLIAHAWLEHGGTVVLGDHGKDAVERFSFAP